MASLFNAMLATEVCPLMRDCSDNKLEVVGVNGERVSVAILPYDGGCYGVDYRIQTIDELLCSGVLVPVNF